MNTPQRTQAAVRILHGRLRDSSPLPSKWCSAAVSQLRSVEGDNGCVIDTCWKDGEHQSVSGGRKRALRAIRRSVERATSGSCCDELCVRGPLGNGVGV